jgi:hypothetical protein
MVLTALCKLQLSSSNNCRFTLHFDHAFHIKRMIFGQFLMGDLSPALVSEQIMTAAVDTLPVVFF